MITARVHRVGRETVVAACDKDLIGKVLRDGELRLEVASSFYEGEDVDEEKLLSRLSLATIANLVGHRTISIAAKHNYINEDCVLMIAGVPHAQMVKM
ncbi:MAG: DUF424 family protein [Methanomassiliicoccales archaeon]|nr:DUF424 family protein [Methanomassiliicoccales archaeon]